ncbi:hypothetical protein SAMN06298216_1317 [Spirosomataceae bacterium TFI 002]|nr:hypothetical protein SAMN06298216_1317 [Spirosomataceae bacterium TFI 002]
MKKLQLVLFCLLLVSCETNPSALLDVGVWGSDTASMSVNEENASIQFTCATGAIPLSIKLDGKNSFKLSGTYSRLSGPPPPDENYSRAFPAIYSGQIKGDILELSVMVDSLEIMQNYSLKFGDQTIVPICP